eukprot:403332153
MFASPDQNVNQQQHQQQHHPNEMQQLQHHPRSNNMDLNNMSMMSIDSASGGAINNGMINGSNGSRNTSCGSYDNFLGEAKSIQSRMRTQMQKIVNSIKSVQKELREQMILKNEQFEQQLDKEYASVDDISKQFQKKKVQMVDKCNDIQLKKRLQIIFDQNTQSQNPETTTSKKFVQFLSTMTNF